MKLYFEMDSVLIGDVDIDRIYVGIEDKLQVFVLTSCEFITFLCRTCSVNRFNKYGIPGVKGFVPLILYIFMA